MHTRWECRYSSCEMLYLVVADDGSEVRMFLDHSEAKADRYAAADVLAGRTDADVRNLFGDAVVAEVKAAIRQLQANPIRPETEADKQAKREARRREARP